MRIKAILMKTIIKLSILIICILSLSNCKKEKTEKSITIKNSEVYELDLMAGGDEEGASITTQAEFFEISEINRDSSTYWSPIYKYKPLPDYVGTDFVEIEACTGGESTGCSNIEIVRIHFTVTK